MSASRTVVLSSVLWAALGCTRPDPVRAPAAPDPAASVPTTSPAAHARTASVAVATALLPSDGPAHRILVERCALCHGLEHVAQQRLPLAKWNATIEKMARWGTPLAEGEAAVLASALAEALPPELPDVAPRRVSTPPGGRPTPPPGATP